MNTPAHLFDPFAKSWYEAAPTDNPTCAIVQLGRYGDIVNAMPIAYLMSQQGYEIHWYVDVAFIDIFEAVSYIHAHPMNVGDGNVTLARQIAESDGHDRVIVPQVNGNKVPPPLECDNFTLRQWANAGEEFIERYHDYRPGFNRRDYAGEAAACAVLPPEDGRPLLLVNFAGFSSAYPHAAEQLAWLHEVAGDDYRIFDLSTLAPHKPGSTENPNQLQRIHHLLGFLSRAAAIVTIDTLSLHLAYETMTPTIQLSAGKNPAGMPSREYDSEPRRQVVFKCTYAESVKPAWRNRIAAILKEKDFAPGHWIGEINAASMVPVGGRRIIHVADWYTGCAEDNPRVFRARATWEELRRDPSYRIKLHEIAPGQRTSQDLGDSRRLPYIRDIIDYGCAGADGDDIIVFTNSDVCLVPEALHEIRKKLESGPCCFSRRVDVKDSAPKRRLRDLRKEVAHVGADLFAMTAEFWLAHRSGLPDLFLAAEGFDMCMRHWMWQRNPDAEMKTCVIWHQQHRSEWSKTENIHHAPSQIHNRRECAKWAKANGCEAALYGNANKFLFKSDSEWREGDAVTVKINPTTPRAISMQPGMVLQEA